MPFAGWLQPLIVRQFFRETYPRILITPTARKHGITDAQIRTVVQHTGLVFDEPPPYDFTDPDRLLFLGDDQHGTALEVLGLLEEDGELLLVIHAMRLRRRYRALYIEALPWRVP